MKFIVHSNIWISLGAVGLLWVTDLLGNTCHSSWHLYSIVFFATLLTYNWQRFLSVKTRQRYDETGRNSWIGRNLVSGYLASAVAALVCIYNFYHLYPNQQAALVLLGLVSVVYALPIIPTPRGLIRLRDFGITKPIVLGITWGLVTAWLPLLVPSDSYLAFSLPDGADNLFIIARCLMMVAICIPFDVKDMAFDSATMAYPTLPVKLGVGKTLAIAILLSFSAMFCFALWVMATGWGTMIIAAAFISFLTEVGLIKRTQANSPEWHYIFALDGLLLLHVALLAGAYWLEVGGF